MSGQLHLPRQKVMSGRIDYYLAGLCFLMVCMVLAPAGATSCNTCPEGEYCVDEIGKCRSCGLVCHTPKLPEDCISICKAPYLEVEDNCSKGYHFESGIGKCRACSITCHGKPKENCPSVCEGWDTTRATPEMSTSTVNPTQHDEGQLNPPQGGNRKSDSEEVDIQAGVQDFAQPTKASISTITKIGLGIGIGGFGILLIVSTVVGVVLYRRNKRRQLANNARTDEEAVQGNAEEHEMFNLEDQQENQRQHGIQEEEQDGILTEEAQE